MQKKRLCVFCGSGEGKGERYLKLAQNLGLSMVHHDLDLVYGGASIGLMGMVAKTVLEQEGEVFGVIPSVLEDREITLKQLKNLTYVGSMHERKQLMYDLSDGFLLIPGGIGSFDEFFEIYCWKQLFIHKKPIGILNAFDYYEPLLRQIEKAKEEGFIDSETQTPLWVGDSLDNLSSFFKLI